MRTRVRCLMICDKSTIYIETTERQPTRLALEAPPQPTTTRLKWPICLRFWSAPSRICNRQDVYNSVVSPSHASRLRVSANALKTCTSPQTHTHTHIRTHLLLYRHRDMRVVLCGPRPTIIAKLSARIRI